jgi:hypothetical protein
MTDVASENGHSIEQTAHALIVALLPSLPERSAAATIPHAQRSQLSD